MRQWYLAAKGFANFVYSHTTNQVAAANLSSLNINQGHTHQALGRNFGNKVNNRHINVTVDSKYMLVLLFLNVTLSVRLTLRHFNLITRV